MFLFHLKNTRLGRLAVFTILSMALLNACQSDTPEPEADQDIEEVVEEAEESSNEEPAEEAEPTATLEPATSTPEPTAVPPTETPTQEPTPTEEPVMEMEGTVYESAEHGYSIVIPDQFEAVQDGTDVLIDSFADDEEAYLLFTTDVDTHGQELLPFLVDTVPFLIGESGTMNEPVPVSINGAEGHSISFETEDEGVSIKGAFVAIESENGIGLQFGGGSSDYWDSSFEAVFNQIANSIQLMAPVEAAESELAGEISVPAVASTGVSGLACMAGKNTGLSCINPDGSWSYFDDDNSNLSSSFISAMTTCPDNRIVLATSGDLNLFDGAAFQVIAGDWGYSSVDQVACGADGTLWVVFFDGAGFYDGTSWTIFEAAEFTNDGSSLVSDVAISEDGTAWVMTSNSVSAYQNGAWTIYDEDNGLGDQYFFNQLGLSASGQLIASYSDGFLTFDGSAWNNVEADDYYNFQDVVTLGDNIWFETFGEGVIQYDGQTFTPIDRDYGLSSNGVNDVAVDTSGRVWVGTDYGINLITADGIQTFHMANSDIADQHIRHVVVVADGPEVLPAVLEKGTGGIEGSVVFEDGAPLADARVELCAEGLSFAYVGTPCSDQAHFYQATTDSDGNFLVEDVAVGYYVTVIEAKPNEWAQVVGQFGFSAERLLVEEGETTSIGEITITEDE